MSQKNRSPYDAIAEQYDDLFVGNRFYDIITEKEEVILESYIPISDGTHSALDIGCGTGDYTRWLAQRGYKTLGIDLSGRMCWLACRAAEDDNPKPNFLQYDAREIESFKDKFDVIICMGSTLNHIDNWSRVFKGISRTLKLNGRTIFSIDNMFGIDSFIWLFKRHQSGYKPETRLQKFRDNVKCALATESFHNDWNMTVSSNEITVKLTYENTRKVKKLLESNGLKLITHRGANFLSCLVPSILNASFELGDHITKKNKGKLIDLVISADNRLADLARSFAANSIIVAERIAD